jgi:hypothetical protein
MGTSDETTTAVHPVCIATFDIPAKAVVFIITVGVWRAALDVQWLTDGAYPPTSSEPNRKDMTCQPRRLRRIWQMDGR